MGDLLTDAWRRQGCSLVWDETLLVAALGDRRPHALREALLWPSTGYPAVAVGSVVVVAGLQVCLELSVTPAEAEAVLRARIQPLIRDWQAQFPASALIFALATDAQAWSFDAAGQAVLTLRPTFVINAALALWSGTGRDASRIVVERAERTGKTKPNFGGLYVRRLS